MSNIYLVFHPMGEPSYSRKRKPQRVSIPWNTSPHHKRKFINRDGLWLDPKTNIVQQGSLYFWGEYEAGSDATLVSTTKPRAIHDVLKSAQGSAPFIPNAINTDPYVFGNHFKHICCGMRNRHYVSGDVILFGNIQNNNPNKFILDTVFVVEKTCKIDFSLNTTQYYKASIEPLKGSKSEFYRGDMYPNGTKYYCYVPCLLSEEEIDAKRPNDVHPVIDTIALGFDPKKAGWQWRAKPRKLTDDIWNTILKEVTTQGWKIGVRIN